MDLKITVFKDRIFIFAIVASALWHIFWLSAVTVVSAPDRTGPLKFSRVSFLGPILEMKTPSLRVEPKERSFLEKRYITVLDRYNGYSTEDAVPPEKMNKDYYYLNDITLKRSIAGSLEGDKLEPPQSVK